MTLPRVSSTKPDDLVTVAGVNQSDLLAEDLASREELRKALEGHEALVQAEKRSALSRLAAGVAHQLRNPLAVILARTQLLLMALRNGSEWSPERAEKALKTVESQTVRASRIIETLSAYVRRRRPEMARIELNEVIGEALESMRDRIPSGAVKVQTDFTQGSTAVLADRSQLHQVFAGLVLNAVQAMPEGGTVTIRTEARAPESPKGSVVATVADTGVGIQPEHLGRIFDPFFSTKPQGSGLGLSIAQGIVETHKGVIRVESEVGVGTAVIVEFPAAPSPDRHNTATGRTDS